MSTVKISQLVEINHLNTDTANTIFPGVDIPSGITGKFTATTLAEGLYSHNPLKVGNNEILFDHTIGQFTGTDETFLQVNLQNFSGNGSGDYIITANNGTNSNSYIDMGLNGSTYNNIDYSSMSSYDGYLYVSGPSADGNKGNLIIGTTSSGAVTNFIVGGATSSNIVAQIITDGLKLKSGKKITFGDNTTQTTAAAPASTTLTIFDYANTIDAYAQSSNTWLQANDFSVLVSSKSYTDTANNFLQANDFTTLVLSKNYTDVANSWSKEYTDTANNWIQSNYLANTSGIFNGSLQFIGSITTSGNVNTTSVHMSDEILFSSNAIIRTLTGVNNSKNITLSAGNDLGGYNAGSLSLTAGSSTSTGGVGGNITLTPGAGNVSNGSVIVNGTIKLKTSVTDNSVFLFISGANNFASQPPSNPGYTIHTTSLDGEGNRIVADAFGANANNYASFIGRRGRGTAASPTALQNGDVIARFGGNGFGTTKFSQFGDGRIEIVANENFTDTSKRTRIDFLTTETGSNSANIIASFNSNTVTFTGSVEPQKGFVFTPRVLQGAQTAITIDFTNDSMVRATLVAPLTISLSNYTYGKVVELWLTNTDNQNRAVTHGCFANNSTIGATSFNLTAGRSAYLRYFSIDGDNANTFVSVNYS